MTVSRFTACLVTLMVTTFLVASTISTPAQAALRTPQIADVSDVRTTDFAATLSIRYTCEPFPAGAPSTSVGLVATIQQYDEGHAAESDPPDSSFASGPDSVAVCDNTLRTQTVTLDYVEGKWLKTGVAVVVVTVGSGARSAVYERADQPVTVPEPCCAPEIAWVTQARLVPSDQPTGEMEPNAAAALRIKYRCWPFAPYPFNDPLMNVSLDQDDAQYLSFYDGGGLAMPVCVGTWQQRTIFAYRAGDGDSLVPGRAAVSVNLSIAAVEGPEEGHVFASGSATYHGVVRVWPDLSRGLR